MEGDGDSIKHTKVEVTFGYYIFATIFLTLQIVYYPFLETSLAFPEPTSKLDDAKKVTIFSHFLYFQKAYMSFDPFPHPQTPFTSPTYLLYNFESGKKKMNYLL